MPMPDDAPAVGERSRRQVLWCAAGVLGAGVVSLLAGCRVRLEQEPIRTPPPPTDDDLARADVAAEADRLLDLIEEARLLRPDAAAELGRIADDHHAHLSALRLPSSTTTPSPKPTSAIATPPGPTLRPASALRVLAARESAAAQEVLTTLGGVSGELARLLASIAASRSCHAGALTSLTTA